MGAAVPAVPELRRAEAGEAGPVPADDLGQGARAAAAAARRARTASRFCYDPDENGVFRKTKDFVTGLNIASGFCIGNGGVYVVQPPYLLFYPDKNDDDVPDGDPEVLLSGFGMDDTHSLANSLQWGPDGWLYGAAGSTSTCKIKNPANPKDAADRVPARHLALPSEDEAVRAVQRRRRQHLRPRLRPATAR